ncbi:unnamed protein product [Colias eurytheme]|nr:unnamed protein product [Colias eurytheme]
MTDHSVTVKHSGSYPINPDTTFGGSSGITTVKDHGKLEN